jgi:uncharacterized protein YggT (Ycf19 family)
MKTTAIKIARVLLWLVYLWVAITLVLLFLLFVLQLFGANPTAGFVDWVYRSTERAMAPFRGIFEPVTVSDKSTLDISVLFAMIVYAFVALGLHLLIDWVTRRLRASEHDDTERDRRAAAAGPAKVVHLTGPTGVTATAVLQPTTYGTSVSLTAAGLDPSHSYSAWLEGPDGGRVSTATFQPNAVGTVDLALTTAAPLASSSGFGITILPRPGEATSTDILQTRIA